MSHIRTVSTFQEEQDKNNFNTYRAKFRSRLGPSARVGLPSGHTDLFSSFKKKCADPIPTARRCQFDQHITNPSGKGQSAKMLTSRFTVPLAPILANSTLFPKGSLLMKHNTFLNTDMGLTCKHHAKSDKDLLKRVWHSNTL